MYAIVEEGGRQIKVAEGDVIRIERVAHAAGETFALGRVLLVSRGNDVLVGAPALENVTVSAEVKRHDRAKKVISRKFRRRKGSTVKRGHRQEFTEILVKQISVK